MRHKAAPPPHVHRAIVFARRRQCEPQLAHRSLGHSSQRRSISLSVFAGCARATSTDRHTHRRHYITTPVSAAHRHTSLSAHTYATACGAANNHHTHISTVITSEILMPNSRCQIHHKYIDHLSALYVTRHQQIYKTHSTAHKQEISERCASWQTNKSGFKITKRVAQNNQK